MPVRSVLGMLAPALLWACTANSPRPADSAGGSASPSYATEFTEVEEVAPLERGFLDGYGALVRRVVLPDADVRTWMVARPSFTDEYGVALIAPDSDDATDPWTLTVVTANVYHAGKFQLGDARAEAALGRDDFESSTRSMSIDAESAGEIVATFESVVRRARNPMPVYEFDEGVRYERTSIGCDGTTYEFRGGRFHGQTWSPAAGPAAELVVLADLLVATVDADVELREEWLRNCVASARALRERVEALPW